MRRLLLLPALLVTASCATYAGTARSMFVHDATCPADRVIVAHAPPAPAPPDIARDPGRLAVWNDEAARRAEHQLVATGCGQTHRYVCDTQSATVGESTTSWVACTPDDAHAELTP